MHTHRIFSAESVQRIRLLHCFDSRKNFFPPDRSRCDCCAGIRWWMCVKINKKNADNACWCCCWRGREGEELRPNSIMTRTILAICTNIAAAVHAHHAHFMRTHTIMPAFVRINFVYTFILVKLYCTISVKYHFNLGQCSAFVWYMTLFFHELLQTQILYGCNSRVATAAAAIFSHSFVVIFCLFSFSLLCAHKRNEAYFFSFFFFFLFFFWRRWWYIFFSLRIYFLMNRE